MGDNEVSNILTEWPTSLRTTDFEKWADLEKTEISVWNREKWVYREYFLFMNCSIREGKKKGMLFFESSLFNELKFYPSANVQLIIKSLFLSQCKYCITNLMILSILHSFHIGN